MFPGCCYTLTTWYTPAQIHSRTTIYYSGASLAGAFSGLLAYGIGHLDGTWGYKGWRFIYVVRSPRRYCLPSPTLVLIILHRLKASSPLSWLVSLALCCTTSLVRSASGSQTMRNGSSSSAMSLSTAVRTPPELWMASAGGSPDNPSK
jgi:hypothetical protein